MEKLEVVLISQPLLCCAHVEKERYEKMRSKKEHVWWEVQVAGAMIELLFDSGDYWMLTQIHA
jgi:hypothetical protein